MSIKVATWNVNSLRVRLPHVIEFIKKHQPDMLALQEIKMENANFPQNAFDELGYQAIFNGQKTYNGVAILSKKPAQEIIHQLPDFADEQKRVLASTIDNIRIINLYVPNGSALDSDKYQYKLNWLNACTHFLSQELKQHENVVVCGDFNIAPADLDVYDPKAWIGQVLVSEPERAVFQQWLDLGFKDTFRQFHADGKHYSWWDYRAAAFRRNLGLRIDHILATPALAACGLNCEIDIEPRRLEQPSDHAPVIALFR